MRTIKEWAVDDRPREKLANRGPASLSNTELLAILIGSGTRNLSAIDLSRRILSDMQNDIGKLSNVTLQELKEYPGIGTVKAVSMLAAIELSGRILHSGGKDQQFVKSSNDVFKILRSKFNGLKHEEFYAVYLNRANKVLQIEQISKGGLSGTVADGKVIFNHAISHRASAIILAHNHPSGQLRPSNADRSLTKNLKDFGKMIDLQILDHLIVTTDNYFSFADEGIM
jgi:DNA repair protein RadC